MKISKTPDMPASFNVAFISINSFVCPFCWRGWRPASPGRQEMSGAIQS